MSKASMRTGSRSSPSSLLQRVERLGPLLAAVLAPQPVLGQRQLGVALGQLAQAAQVPALRDADLDRGVALGAERLRQHLGAALSSGPTTTRGGIAGAAV